MSSSMDIYGALVALHAGCLRQGPGDEAIADSILDRLPPLPEESRVADLGCGTGTASLWLARRLNRPVLSVDLAEEFLTVLKRRAAAQGLAHLVMPLCADMGALQPGAHRFGLIWSEGAAYNLTFEGALKAWRPLLADGRVAVISEMSWFGPDRPEEAAEFWAEAYPAMAEEQENLRLAAQHGYRPLFTERLPEQAWWDSYYGPLQRRMNELSGSASAAMQEVLEETRAEMALFRKHAAAYGYTFYVLKAV